MQKLTKAKVNLGTTLRITHIYANTNMHSIHRLRKLTFEEHKELGSGQAVLFINKAESMARLIDCMGTVFCMYALNDELFDVDLCKDMLKGGLNLNVLVQTNSTKQKKVA